jgi:hypothetical protein
MNKLAFVTAAILCFIFTINPASAQIPKEYYNQTKKADSLFKLKDYKNSAIAFSSAFKVNGGKGLLEDRYKAACAWAMIKNADSAFFQLYRITDKLYFNDYNRVVKEEYFKNLYNDVRWEKLLDQIKINKSFNSGFERVKASEPLPSGWFEWGTKDYALRPDSSQKHSGKYSVLIEPTEDITEESFGCVAHAIPAEYKGKKIEVRAYIKMENVTEPIGLLLRIDGKNPNESLGFDNMTQKKIQGTKDWTLYSVSLPLPKNAETIYIGALLSGSGKLWVDDFQVLIDGKDINDLAINK